MGCGQSQVGIAPRNEDNNIPTEKPNDDGKVKIDRPRSKTIQVQESNTPKGSPVLLEVSIFSRYY